MPIDLQAYSKPVSTPSPPIGSGTDPGNLAGLLLAIFPHSRRPQQSAADAFGFFYRLRHSTSVLAACQQNLHGKNRIDREEAGGLASWEASKGVCFCSGLT